MITIAGLPLFEAEGASDEELLRAIESGALIYFDRPELRLSEYKTHLGLMRGISASRVIDASLLEDAASLEVLYARSSDRADLSRLPRLRDVKVGPNLQSALENPNVVSATIEGAGVPERLGKGLVSLHVETPSVDGLVALAGTQLKELTLDSEGVVDLRGVAQLEHLESITLVDAGEVRGFAELAAVPSLKSLTLVGARRVDDIDVLLGMRLDSIVIWRNRIVGSRLAQRLREQRGHCDIEPFRGKSAAAADVFDLHEHDGHWELSTDQFDWFEAASERAGINTSFDGYSLEELLRTTIAGLGEFGYDSESSAVRILGPSRERLSAARDALVKVWSRPAALRGLYNASPSNTGNRPEATSR